MDVYSTVGAVDSAYTQWSVPELLQVANMLAEKDGNGCIILLDDIHRMSMAVLPYMYELLLERKLGQYKLHDSVAIIGTMNDSDDAGFSGMDSPIRNRLAIHKTAFDFDVWFNAHGIGYHPFVSSFLNKHPQYVQEDESTGIEGFGTPRSYHFLSSTFDNLDRDFIIENAKKLAEQYISTTAANELAKHIKYIEAIDFTTKVKSRQMIDIDALDPLDAILYAYITYYIETVDDVQYFIELLEANVKCSSFVGFCIGNIFASYQQMEKGKKVTDGMRAIISLIIKKKYPAENYTTYSPTAYAKIDKIKFKDASIEKQLLSLASEFIL